MNPPLAKGEGKQRLTEGMMKIDKYGNTVKGLFLTLVVWSAVGLIVWLALTGGI